MSKPNSRFAVLALFLLSLSLILAACGEEPTRVDLPMRTVTASTSPVNSLAPTPAPIDTPSGAIATIQADATALAQTQPTRIPKTFPTPTKPPSQPTITAALDTFAALSKRAKRVSGPFISTLYHNNRSFIRDFRTYSLKLQNFIAEVKLFNPYDTDTGDWSSGFTFRVKGGPESDKSQEYHLFITSHKTWVCRLVYYDSNRQNFVDVEIIANGVINDLDVSAEGSNRLAIAVNGEQLILKVNDKFVSSFNLPDAEGSSYVSVAEGLCGDDQIEDESTKFTEFTVYDLGK